MSNIPPTEPVSVTAGDTIQWTRSLADYPASAGWVLSYAYRGPGAVNITAAADGDDYLVSIGPAVSTGYAAGDYAGQAYVSRFDDDELLERYTVEPLLRLSVLPGLAATTGSYDPRTTNEKILAAIDATIAGSATSDQRRIVIGDKQLERFDRADLLTMRGTYAHKVWMERNPGLLAPSISFSFGGGP